MADDLSPIGAEPGAVASLARSVEPTSPRWQASVLEYLGSPRSFEEVESVEALLKRQWRDVVAGGASAGDAFRFSEFFAEVGFFKKYKPYGVKFAAPFGYSIFVLRPRLGFSVQVHRAQKIEAFHILESHAGAFALVGTPEEWRSEREAFLAQWREGRPEASSLVFVPRAGDVFVIDRPETVHTMVGCTLEEYATTSNDAVERLHDQYESRQVQLPSRHPDLGQTLGRCRPIVPTRRIERKASGWETLEIKRATREHVICRDDLGLDARHVFLEQGESAQVEIGLKSMGTLTILEGRVMCGLAGGEKAMRCGDTMPVVPGALVALAALEGTARVAVCQVGREMAFEDLRSGG